jgi:hypothetical protein
MDEQNERAAWTQFLLLRKLGVLDYDLPPEVEFGQPGTDIHDLNGTLLYRRLPLVAGDRQIGYIDVAMEPALCSPLLAVSVGLPWREAEIVARARAMVPGSYDYHRFIAFSYPKVGVQFLVGSSEVRLIEVPTYREVPLPAENEFGDIIASERESLLEALPSAVRERNAAKFKELLDVLLADLQRVRLSRDFLEQHVDSMQVTCRIRRLLYSLHLSNHLCFELRRQETNVWCVAACAQMLLDFYRYEYSQEVLAQELGLGTISMPTALDCSAAEFEVIRAVDRLSRGALDVVMNVCWPSFWDEIEAELCQNRPTVLFSFGHARVVGGFFRILVLDRISLRGLLLYDPQGVVAHWECFDGIRYRTNYTANLRRAGASTHTGCPKCKSKY